jgi:hypothetical protein
MPVELVDTPRGEAGLFERTNARTGGPECLRQRVARGRELSERQLIQPIDFDVEGRFGCRA